MGFYHDKQEYEALNARFAGDMRAFKQKVVQVIANASYDPDTTWFPSDPMDELDVDDFLNELALPEAEEDEDENPMGINWNIGAPKGAVPYSVSGGFIGSITGSGSTAYKSPAYKGVDTKKLVLDERMRRQLEKRKKLGHW